VAGSADEGVLALDPMNIGPAARRAGGGWKGGVALLRRIEGFFSPTQNAGREFEGRPTIVADVIEATGDVTGVEDVARAAGGAFCLDGDESWHLVIKMIIGV
jgi:hypothetical protein